MPEVISSIRVDYKHRDGWHIFTCEALPGLYVASEDAKRAYNDVAVAVKMLLSLDYAMECQVQPETPFDEFASVNHVRTSRARPTSLETHRYAVYACA